MLSLISTNGRLTFCFTFSLFVFFFSLARHAEAAPSLRIRLALSDINPHNSSNLRFGMISKHTFHTKCWSNFEGRDLGNFQCEWQETRHHYGHF